MKNPLILDIKANSLDDGPGIRTTVFFKGCPLSCIWCHNPESKNIFNELSYDKENCIGCKSCIKECKNEALSFSDILNIDREKCKLCFSCADICPSKALLRAGNEIELENLLDKLLSDKVFYDISSGGVTLSGGEATMHMEWIGELSRRLNENGVSVLLETCGLFDYEKAKKLLLPYLSMIYCDLKIFDKDKHTKYCGVSNERIIENIKRLKEDEKCFSYSLLVRTPLIPGITDTDENLKEIASFEKNIGIKNTQLLSYNPTWYSKLDKLGKELNSEIKTISAWQNRDELEEKKNIFKSFGIEC